VNEKLLDDDYAKKLENEAWYYRNRSLLKKDYYGQFVAIYNGKVIAHEKHYPLLVKKISKMISENHLDHYPVIKNCGKEYLENPAVIPLESASPLVGGHGDYFPESLPIINEFENQKPPTDELEYQTLKDFKAKFFFAGEHDRPFATLPIKISTPKKIGFLIPITFLVDTGSPFTHLSADTILKLLDKKTKDANIPKSPAITFGKDTTVVPQLSHSPFTEFNLLGTDVIYTTNLQLDYSNDFFEMKLD